jgi:hypothetical protein
VHPESMKLEIKWSVKGYDIETIWTVANDTRVKDILVDFMLSARDSLKDKDIGTVYPDRVVLFDVTGRKLDGDKTIEEEFPAAKPDERLKLVAGYDCRGSERVSKRKRED